jgi:hypothetical protein
MTTFAIMAPDSSTTLATGNIAGCIHTGTHVLKQPFGGTTKRVGRTLGCFGISLMLTIYSMI